MHVQQMRPSRVLAKLRAGAVVNCFKLNLADARAMEIAARAGFDCLWPDMEHVPKEPLVELDAIAALPGIDILFFGPADFSHGIGAPGVWDHPRLLDARRRVAEAAQAHGKYAGTVASPANRDHEPLRGQNKMSVSDDGGTPPDRGPLR